MRRWVLSACGRKIQKNGVLTLRFFFYTTNYSTKRTDFSDFLCNFAAKFRKPRILEDGNSLIIWKFSDYMEIL